MINFYQEEKAYRNSVYNILALLLVLFSIIEINAPITTYGIQLGGLFFLLVIRFLLDWKLKITRMALVIFISAFLIIMTYLQSTYLEYAGILWLNSIRVIFWISVAILFYDYFLKIKLSTLSRIIGGLILLSALTVILQLVANYILRTPIDLSIMLGGQGVRSVFDLGGISYRPTGLTSEPAIHSGITFALIVLKTLIDKKSNHIILLGLLSICLTLSTLGILLAIGYIVVMYTRRISHILLSIIFLSILIIFLSDQLLFRYESFIEGNDGSNSVKVMVFEEFISNAWIKTLGFGFVGMDGTSPTFYEALYDMTLFFNLFIYFGIYIGIVLLIYVLYLIFISFKFSFRYKLLIVLALVKISGPTIMFFSFFIMLLCVVHNKQKQFLIDG